jgi:Ca2+-binding RTX toxin-like protein
MLPPTNAKTDSEKLKDYIDDTLSYYAECNVTASEFNQLIDNSLNDIIDYHQKQLNKYQEFQRLLTSRDSSTDWLKNRDNIIIGGQLTDTIFGGQGTDTISLSSSSDNPYISYPEYHADCFWDTDRNK